MIIDWVDCGNWMGSDEFAHAVKRSAGGVARVYEGISSLGMDRKDPSSNKRADTVLAKHCAFMLLDCVWILGRPGSASSQPPAFASVLEAIKPGVFFLLGRLEEETALMQHVHAVLGSADGGGRRAMLSTLKAEWEKTKHSGKI